eukprot:Rmarinus@m.17059
MPSLLHGARKDMSALFCSFTTSYYSKSRTRVSAMSWQLLRLRCKSLFLGAAYPSTCVLDPRGVLFTQSTFLLIGLQRSRRRSWRSQAPVTSVMVLVTCLHRDQSVEMLMYMSKWKNVAWKKILSGYLLRLELLLQSWCTM